MSNVQLPAKVNQDDICLVSFANVATYAETATDNWKMVNAKGDSCTFYRLPNGSILVDNGFIVKCIVDASRIEEARQHVRDLRNDGYEFEHLVKQQEESEIADFHAGLMAYEEEMKQRKFAYWRR